MANKKIITNLIREDLRNKFLVCAFNELKFDFSAFSLHISTSILELSGFRKQPKDLLQWYANLTECAINEVTCWNQDEMLDYWTEKIREELERKRREVSGL